MMCMKIVDDKSTYLYRCYDRHAVLLYVGITVNPDQRMRSHTFDKFWWGDVVKTTYMAFKTREQALWAEWAVITTCHPLYNVMSQIPPEHRCPDQPLAIDGYISIIFQYRTVLGAVRAASATSSVVKYFSMRQQSSRVIACPHCPSPHLDTQIGPVGGARPVLAASTVPT
jgi:predicted GIY-YIG superfamily endonuclease